VAVLDGHTAEVCSVRFDSMKILSASWDKTIRMWDIRNVRQSVELIRVFEGHTDGLWSIQYEDGPGDTLRFSEEESRNLGRGFIISGSRDTTLRIWDLWSGKSWGRFEGHAGRVLSVGVCEDKIVSGGGEGLVKLWDLGSKQWLGDMKGHGGRVWSVAMDHERVVSGGSDACVKVWYFEGGGKVGEDEDDVIINLSESEGEPDGGAIINPGGGSGGRWKDDMIINNENKEQTC